jgi:cytochrome c2
MKKIFKIVLWTIAGMATYIHFSGIPSYPELAAKIPTDYKIESTPERVAKGAKIASLACYDCHSSNKEQRLSGKEILDIPKEFGAVYSKNITNDPKYGIGKWTDGELAYFLRTGVRKDGSFAPMYMPKLPLMSEEDMAALIAFLRSDEPLVQPSERVAPMCRPSFLTKALSHFVMKPYPANLGPKTTPTEQIAQGKYLADAMYGCTNCHSADFKKSNELNPPENLGYCGGGNVLLTLEGENILAANISPDKETGIGTWTADEFLNAVKFGKGKDGQPLRYPMMPKTALDTSEVMAIFAYLQTVPAIHNKIK